MKTESEGKQQLEDIILKAIGAADEYELGCCVPYLAEKAFGELSWDSIKKTKRILRKLSKEHKVCGTRGLWEPGPLGPRKPIPIIRPLKFAKHHF